MTMSDDLGLESPVPSANRLQQGGHKQIVGFDAANFATGERKWKEGRAKMSLGLPRRRARALPGHEHERRAVAVLLEAEGKGRNRSIEVWASRFSSSFRATPGGAPSTRAHNADFTHPFCCRGGSFPL